MRKIVKKNTPQYYINHLVTPLQLASNASNCMLNNLNHSKSTY